MYQLSQVGVGRRLALPRPVFAFWEAPSPACPPPKKSQQQVGNGAPRGPGQGPQRVGRGWGERIRKQQVELGV